jgi:hypothetical protein
VRRAILLVLVLVAAGCGGSDGNSKIPTVDPGTAIGLNGQEVIVQGYFSRAPDATLGQMCPMLDESYPPSCSSPALPVSNLTKEGQQKRQLTRDPETGALWSQNEVELRGSIDEGALVVG